VVGDRRLTFGFEGIWQGTAVLYDHQTGSLWMHFTGECFHGPLAGKQMLRAATGRHTTWKDWRTLHPETDVMERLPSLIGRGTDRGYFDREGAQSGSKHLPPQFGQTISVRDPRLALHTLLYGIVVGRHARAYPFPALADAGVAEEILDGVAVTVWFDRKARSAGAFNPTVGGAVLAFELSADASIRDKQTGSRWTLDGLCVEGKYKGTQLAPLHGLMSEWYGWYASYPKTTLWSRY
jgi:hypothetical protein